MAQNLPENTSTYLSVSVSEVIPGISSDTDISQYLAKITLHRLGSVGTVVELNILLK